MATEPHRTRVGDAPTVVDSPVAITAATLPPERIHEYIGLASTGDPRISIAHMRAPSGWSEPGQRPDFDEITIVLNGALVVEHIGGTIEVTAGGAVHAKANQWVRYSTPSPDGAEKIAVCLPAFSPDTVHRDDHD